jgi:N-acylneuraminate cytidylyltransferase/CMP-N,N'-diacetyllegionaminic acid synthase
VGFRVSLLCTICARGGSKGVPGKNIKSLLGKPLISYSIAQAKESGLFAAIAVSSDSEEVLNIAKKHGADVLVRRPHEMATDSAPKLHAIRHCFETAERECGDVFPIFVDLDATSPLRLPEDIAGAIHLLETTGASSVITGSPARHSPYFNLVELDDRGVPHVCKELKSPLVRRQDAPCCFDMNASIYVWRRAAFLAAPAVFYYDTRLYEMPDERSIDIDSALDWDVVQFLMMRRQAVA